MKVSLVVLTEGNSKGKVIPIPKFPFVIGRDPKCNLRPASPIVSNRHCALESRHGKIYIRDLKSPTATHDNDKPVSDARELRAHDRISIGPLQFDVQVELSLPVDQNTPLPPNRPEKAADEDSIAEVLLAMPDDTTATTGSVNLDKAGIPTGGTEVIDHAPGVDDTAKDDTVVTSDAGKKPKAAGVGDTTIVAQEILKKYLRRPKA